MKFALLASGSAGNCCLISHKQTSIVIDCGSTKKYLTSCFETIGYNHLQSQAILITHTHSDHVSQIKLFRSIPTYATQEIITDHLHSIRPFEEFMIQDLQITVLPMSHDCAGTVGFIVQSEEEKLVYITDTGYIKEEVKARIMDADYYIMESNHDIEMLMQTTRPVYLKQRIIGDCGHLCNEYCANVVTDVMGEHTKEIVLAHISREGNTRELALQALQEQLLKKEKMREDVRRYAAQQFGIYIGGNKTK